MYRDFDTPEVHEIEALDGYDLDYAWAKCWGPVGEFLIKADYQPIAFNRLSVGNTVVDPASFMGQVSQTEEFLSDAFLNRRAKFTPLPAE